VNFDFYNVLNANSVLSENFAYSTVTPGPGVSGWRSPTSILLPRVFKFGVQLDF
jgi:hypothetical protein